MWFLFSIFNAQNLSDYNNVVYKDTLYIPALKALPTPIKSWQRLKAGNAAFNANLIRDTHVMLQFYCP